MGLSPIGVAAVVEGIRQYLNDIDRMNKATATAASGMTSAASKTSAFSGVLTGTLTVAIAGVAVALATATAAIGGMLALMKRGSEIDDIARSFQILEKSLGGNTDQLKALRKGAEGTISDIELMTKANQALIGTTGAFASKFAEALPKLLQIARVQANATGQSVTEVFDAEINGIKEAQPRMLNHVGIIVKTTLANEAYAKSIGKSVADLTLEEQQQAALNAVLLAGGSILSQYGGLAESADEKLARIGATISNIVDTLALAVQPAFKKILDAIQPIMDFLQRFATAAAPYIAAIAQMFANLISSILGPIGKALKAVNAADLAKGFFEGGARMIGALAGGMASAANLVIKVVKVIAQVIASFLSGFSPPPEGPLSTIDVGGANVIKAWLDGFLGVSLDPVAKVAGDVSAMMGNIGSMSKDQVEARLGDLDKALQPFQDRLALVQAEFDAIKPATDMAFSAIDRQMESALKALNAGQGGAAATIRSLDAQRTALEDYVDAQQAEIDAAQVQLALAEAQQAKERAALEIQKRITANQPSAGDQLTVVGGNGLPVAGTGETGIAGGVAAGTVTSSIGDLAGNLGNASKAIDTFSQDVATAMAGMKSAFSDGFTSAGGNVKELEGNFADLQNIWGGITGKVGGFVGQIQGAWATFSGWVTDTLVPILQGIWDNVKPRLDQLVSWFLTDGLPAIQKFVTNTILPFFQGLIDKISALWTAVQPQLQNLYNWFVTEGLPTISNLVSKFNVDIIQPLLNLLSGLWKTIQPALETMFQWFVTDGLPKVAETVNSFYVNIIKPLIDLLAAIWDKIKEPLSNVAKWFNEEGPKLGKAIGDFITSKFTELLTTVQNIFTWVGDLIRKIQELLGLQAQIGSGGGSRGVGDFTGIHGPGQWVVGTGAQPELFTSNRYTYGIPNIDKVLASVGNIMAQPAPMATPSYAYAYNNTYNQQQNMGDINFQGVSGTNDAIRRYALLRAMGRVR